MQETLPLHADAAGPDVAAVMPWLSAGHLLAGKYRIVRPLAAGGMGIVYEAVDTVIGRQVAVKTLKLSPLAAAEDLDELGRRFLLEARAAGRLGHPNIVTVFEAGADGGLHYLVMEYVPGATLAELLRRGGALARRRALVVVLQVAGALGYAHAARVVHRDIKPGNVLVGPDDFVKVTDFGLAKLVRPDMSAATASDLIVGTPLYLSPEQITGEPLDGRSDLFSLAVVLYESLAGQPPFRGENLGALVMQILNGHPDPLQTGVPALDEAYARFFERGLAKARAARFADAGSFADELIRLAALEGLPLERPAPAWRPSEPSKLGGPPPAAGPNGGTPTEIRRDTGAETLRMLSPPDSGWRGRRVWAAVGILVAVLLLGRLAITRQQDTSPLLPPQAAGGRVEGGRPVLLPPPAEVPVPTVAAPPAAITVAIDSEPRGANVYVEGRHAGATPLHLTFAAGSPPSLAAILWKPGYFAARALLPASAGEAEATGVQVRLIPAPGGMPEPVGREWATSRGNPARTGFAPASLPGPPQERWVLPTGGQVVGDPVVAEGVVVTAETGRYARGIELASGRTRWEHRVGGRALVGPSLVSALGLVAVAGDDGKLHLLDLTSGAHRAALPLQDRPIVDLLPAGDTLLVAGEGGHVGSLAVKHGLLGRRIEVSWQATLAEHIRATLALADGRLVVVGERSLFGLEAATGKTLWTARGPAIAEAAAAGDARAPGGGVVVLAGQMVRTDPAGVVAAFELDTGRELWRHQAGGPAGSLPAVMPAVARGVVVVPRGSHLEAIGFQPEPVTLWRSELPSEVVAPPLTIGEQVVVGTNGGQLAAIDLASGKVAWSVELGAGVRSTPAVAGGYLVVADAEGRVHGLAAGLR